MKKEFKKLMFNELANDLDKFTNKDLYQCPHCGKIFEWDDANYYLEESAYTCPECMATFNENELQNITALDYLEEIYLSYKSNNKEDDNETDFE